MILAIDFSLASCGYYICDMEGNESLKGCIPAPKNKFKDKHERENYVANSLSELVLPFSISHVITEDYAFQGSSLSRLAEAYGVVKDRLFHKNSISFNQIYVVAPTSLKKWATGNGRADKKEVMAGIEKKYGIPADSWESDDVCDAFCLSRIALFTISGNCANKDEEDLRAKLITKFEGKKKTKKKPKK